MMKGITEILKNLRKIRSEMEGLELLIEDISKTTVTDVVSGSSCEFPYTARRFSITGVDIDSFIRAKGAIFSAINIMLSSLDMDVTVLEHVYVAGGIGSGINMENAVRIGMLPDIDRELFEYLGNTSLSGAYAMARSDCAVDKVDELASNMTYLELSTNPRYMDEFVAACFLPHTNRELFPSSIQE